MIKHVENRRLSKLCLKIQFLSLGELSINRPISKCSVGSIYYLLRQLHITQQRTLRTKCGFSKLVSIVAKFLLKSISFLLQTSSTAQFENSKTYNIDILYWGADMKLVVTS